MAQVRPPILPVCFAHIVPTGVVVAFILGSWNLFLPLCREHFDTCEPGVLLPAGLQPPSILSTLVVADGQSATPLDTYVRGITGVT